MLRRIIALFRKRAIEADMDKEMNFHVDMLSQRLEDAGIPRDEAHHAARRRFGNLVQLKERGRDAKVSRMLDELRQDVFFGIRTLCRNPGFSVLAILCLTIGIGANTAVYSWIEGILLRPYALVVNQDRLLVLSGVVPGAPKGVPVSWPDFKDLRQSCTLCDAFIAEKIVGTTLSVGGDRADRVTGSVVSANYFDAFGVHPILGRGFETSDDEGRNAHPVVVISYQLWKDRLRGDPEIIGRTQSLNGVPHTIIGVAPQGFYGTFVGYSFQFWVPVSMQEVFEPGGYKLEDRGAQWIEGFVRLKPGVTATQAQNEVAVIAKRLQSEYPRTNRAREVRLLPLWQSPFNAMEVMTPTLFIALAVVSAVLLIACANVGNLLLLKALARRREMTIRLSVGAGARRLLKQLLTEGFLLCAISGLCGILLAYLCRNVFGLFFPPRGNVVLRLPAEIDWRVLSLSAAVCLFSTLLIGVFPVLMTRKINLSDALKTESGAMFGSGGKAWIRSALVIVQISLSFVLLVGAGLGIKSLSRMRATSPGFSTGNVVTTAIDLVSAGYSQDRARLFQDELIERLRTVSGIESAVFVRRTPFTYSAFSSAPVLVDGYNVPLDQIPQVEYNEVGPAYFVTVGIPILSGRDFAREDNEGSALVAVINEAMAEQYWHGQNPIGRRLQIKGRSIEVVGVAKVSKYRNLLETPVPFFYVPMRQSALGQNLNIRTSLALNTVSAALLGEIHAIDPNVAPTEIVTMREQVERMSSSQTMAVTLLGSFGAVALFLAAIGLYGVMSSSIAHSVREIGLRVALGATRSMVMGLVFSRGFVLTLAGVLFGVIAALELTQKLGFILFKVSPQDPFAFGAALIIMLAAAGAACFVPAWRATRTDPARVLRE